MAMRPSILIGLGTSGSEIVGRIYEKYLQLEESGGVQPNQCQFLAVDSDNTAAGGNRYIGLLQPTWRLDMTFPTAQQLRDEMWASDRFFKTWWYEDFKRVGPAVQGCGTVPSKGRLVFWGRLAGQGNNSFQERITATIRQANNVLNNSGTNSVAVYIILTICGGSGSGIFLDVASWIRKLFEENGLPDPEINGCLVMPSIVKLKALPSAHDQIEANGFAALQALSFWQNDWRSAALRTMMQAPGVRLDNVKPPFDLCYLFSQANEDGKGFQRWDEYAGMIADGIATEVMGGVAVDAGSRKNDFVMTIQGKPPAQGRPIMYSSFAVSRLRFRPDRIGRYLSEMAGQSLAGDVLKAGTDTELAAEARRFFELHQIRERGDSPGVPIDEVITRLKAPLADAVSYPDVRIAPRLRSDGVSRKSLKGEMKRLQEAEEVRLTGTVDLPGVSFRSLLIQNRENLSATVLSNIRGPAARPGGLTWWVSDILSRPGGGVGPAISFLDKLEAEAQAHKDDIDRELSGNLAGGDPGQLALAKTYEQSPAGQTRFDQAADKAGAIMYRRFPPGDKDGGIRILESDWWGKWLETRKECLVKEQVLQFYVDLQEAIGKHGRALDQLRGLVDRAKSSLTAEAAKGLGGRDGSDQYVLEKAVLEDRSAVDKVFLSAEPVFDPAQQGGFGQILRESFAEVSRMLEAQSSASSAARAGVDEELTRVQRQLANGLRETASSLFSDQLKGMSLWDALYEEGRAGGADSDADIQRYINGEIAKVSQRARPFWSVNWARARALNISPHEMSTVAYDHQALEQFRARRGWDATYNPLSSERPSELPVGSNTLEIRVARGALPLHVLSEPNLLQEPFSTFRAGNKTVPCYSDRRYEEIGDQISPVNEEADITLQFLKAEHLGVIESPFVNSVGVNAYGNYVYRITPLGRIRQEVIAGLSPGGEHAELMPRIRDAVNNKLTHEFSQQEQIDEWCLMYDRLYQAVRKRKSNDMGLQDQFRLVQDFLDADYDMAEADIEKRTESLKRRARRRAETKAQSQTDDFDDEGS